MTRVVSRTWVYDPTLYAPARYRKACRYNAFVPDRLSELVLDVSGRLAGVISDAEQAVRALNALAAPALAPLARLLLRTESIASSKVEGMQVDARALARAEARVDTGARASTTAAEVLANIDAMVLAVEDATSAARLSIDRLVDIHRVLMATASNAAIGGEIRTVQNWIGGNDYNPCGAPFVPPPEDEVVPLLEDLCAFCNEDELPPLVQAAIAHAQFETIHPFLDGNGRTGRALLQVLLRRRGLAPSYVPPISVVLAAQKDRYIAGLNRYRQGDTNAWLEDFAIAATRSADLARDYLDNVGALRREWIDRLRSRPKPPRSDAAAWAVIDTLVGYPVVTVPVLTALTGRSKPAVGQAVDELVGAGVLEPLTDHARNRAWEATGLLDLITQIDRQS